MRTIPSDPLFVSYHLSACRIMANALTNRKVADRSHLPHLLLQERHYTRVLLGLLSAFYCPLCIHGCVYSLVSNTFLVQESRNSECWCFHSFVSVTLVITINVMRYRRLGDFHIKKDHFSMVDGYNMEKSLECPIVFTLLSGIGRARYCWLYSINWECGCAHTVIH